MEDKVKKIKKDEQRRGGTTLTTSENGRHRCIKENVFHGKKTPVKTTATTSYVILS